MIPRLRRAFERPNQQLRLAHQVERALQVIVLKRANGPRQKHLRPAERPLLIFRQAAPPKPLDGLLNFLLRAQDGLAKGLLLGRAFARTKHRNWSEMRHRGPDANDRGRARWRGRMRRGRRGRHGRRGRMRLLNDQNRAAGGLFRGSRRRGNINDLGTALPLRASAKQQRQTPHHAQPLPYQPSPRPWHNRLPSAIPRNRARPCQILPILAYVPAFLFPPRLATATPVTPGSSPAVGACPRHGKGLPVFGKAFPCCCPVLSSDGG